MLYLSFIIKEPEKFYYIRSYIFRSNHFPCNNSTRSDATGVIPNPKNPCGALFQSVIMTHQLPAIFFSPTISNYRKKREKINCGDKDYFTKYEVSESPKRIYMYKYIHFHFITFIV